MSDQLRRARLDLSRRHLLWCFGAGAITAFAMPVLGAALADPIFRTYPFQLGVASGEPVADGFVIWTRLAPEPFAIGHGMPARAVEVAWEVAEDDRFRSVVRHGTAVAPPELGHSVHIEVDGLAPGRPYWYRFTAGGERSLTGRAMTTPVAGARLDRMRFAVAGCQNYEQGYFTAHRRLAEEELDFVFCYGDYIYEGRGSRLRNGPNGPTEVIRPHFGEEIYTLEDYRRRYAQYKMDADLQAAHAAHAWFSVWDDHETDNNWVTDLDQDGTAPVQFNMRRQAAAQAYYENMPLRASALPVGPAIQLYRQAVYGDLFDLNLLDTRQYRTDQPCNDRWGIECADVAQAQAEVLGRQQHDWLMGNVERSRSQWQVLAQQVMVMDLDRNPGELTTYNLDSWGGYRAPRERLLQGLKDRRAENVVVLTGDEHQNYAGELHIDGKRPGAAPIGIEVVSTSITSGGDGEDQRPEMARIQAANEQLKFNNSQRGYVVCDVNRERFATEFKVLDKVSDRNGVMQTRKTLAVPAGTPRLVEA